MSRQKIEVRDSFNDDVAVFDTQHIPIRVGQRLKLNHVEAEVVYRVTEIEYVLTREPSIEILGDGGVASHQIIYVNKLIK